MRSLLIAVPLLLIAVAPSLAAPAKHHRKAHTLRSSPARIPLTEAITISRQGDASLVLAALKRGESVNERDSDGMTPLMCASLDQWPQLTRLLIHMGANVNAENKDGMNALDYAKNPEVVAILLNAGAKGAKNELVVNADSLETEDSLGTHYVDGYLDNNSKASYDYVEVDAVFFDSAGNQVDSGMDNTQHLAPGATWKFKINSFRDGITSYKIVKISGN